VFDSETKHSKVCPECKEKRYNHKVMKKLNLSN
jgi:hypothetical protein